LRAEAASAAKAGNGFGSFSTEYPANGSFRPQVPSALASASDDGQHTQCARGN